jgi:N-acetylmuramic acid 6-phosphate etherase
VETTSPPLPATETISPRFRDLDAWDPRVMLEAMWQGQLAAVAAVRGALPAIEAAVAAAVPRLARGGRLVYAGAGTSGRIGVQDGAELPPTFDWPPERLVLLIAGGEAALTRAIENAEDDVAAAVAAIERYAIGGQDVAIGLAASGGTPFTVAALREARGRGALTIGVANTAGAPLLAAAEHPIAVETGAEAIAGSTRMQAGTAQKVVLNLFSTLVMIRLGRVYQGLMVDMRATNAKLRHRAVRMLRHLSGRDEAAVQDALMQAEGNVKLARLVLEGLEPEAGKSLLERNAGSLRAALAAHAALAGLGR